MKTPSFATLDISGLGRLQARLKRIKNADAFKLMRTWMEILDNDNRKGVLAGTDKDGLPMKPVSYRPKQPGVRLTIAQRLGQAPKTKRGKYNDGGAEGNLTSSQYRLLDGPPLAPRRQFSRVITNFLTDYDDSKRASGRWSAWGYWDGVVSKQGVPFLQYHFRGQGSLPKRDLRGLRPEGRELAQKAMQAWAVKTAQDSGEPGATSPVIELTPTI